MALAAVSAATFWGGFFLVLGSALVLFSLSKKVMTAKWAEWMTFLGAASLLIGTILTAKSDFSAYEGKHHCQAVLAAVVLGIVVVFVLASLLRAAFGKSVPGEDG